MDCDYISNSHDNVYRVFAYCNKCRASCNCLVEERGRGKNKVSHVLEEKWISERDKKVGDSEQ